MRIVGIVLLVLGLAGLAVGTFQYTRQKKVVDAGPVHISRTACLFHGDDRQAVALTRAH